MNFNIKHVYNYLYNIDKCLVLDRDFKITFVNLCIAMFISTASLAPLSNNANANVVLAQDSNSSVIVENRAMSAKDLLCDDGMHPDADGICADGSHPLVIHANPIPTIGQPVNETNPATTSIVSLCADRTMANSTTGKCLDGSLSLQLSIEDLTCTNGNHPTRNGTCGDGSLPQVLNKTKPAVSGK
jgi:hypothetical protein